MNQPLIFVPYAIALLAKQKGFDEPCLAKIFSEADSPEIGQIFTNAEIEKLSSNPNFVAAPTYQQLVDWLREKHMTFVNINVHNKWQNEFYGEVESDVFHTSYPVTVGYYEAYDYTLERVLKEL